VRVVIDTNVLVSAALGHGKPRRLLRRVMRDHTALTSMELLAELSEVLPREKFSLTEGQVTRFLAIYRRNSNLVATRRHVDAIVEDPDDNAVLEAAVNGGAELLVTGDKHLLRLKGFENVMILNVDAALRILR